MRLAISNIAWDTRDDAAVVDLLHKHEIDAIDVAPAKYFPLPAEAGCIDLLSVRGWWADRGIEIVGMQALLFGTSGFNIFGDVENQKALLAHLTDVCRVGEGLGARRLVFGSPKNRDRTGLDDQQALETAASFFRQLGDQAARFGVTVSLEPNPSIYGSNFMMTSPETEQVVREVGHPAIKMQFDTGAVLINNEEPESVLGTCALLVGHIHLSEPGLVPLGDGEASHEDLANALQKYLPDAVASIEMVATKGEPSLIAVDRAIRFACATYRRLDS